MERLAELERQRRQNELEAKLVEEETAKRIEEMVALRVAEELERRKDEIEAEVLRRVEEAKATMEAEMMEELQKQKAAALEEERKREVHNFCPSPNYHSPTLTITIKRLLQYNVHDLLNLIYLRLQLPHPEEGWAEEEDSDFLFKLNLCSVPIGGKNQTHALLHYILKFLP